MQATASAHQRSHLIDGFLENIIRQGSSYDVETSLSDESSKVLGVGLERNGGEDILRDSEDCAFGSRNPYDAIGQSVDRNFLIERRSDRNQLRGNIRTEKDNRHSRVILGSGEV